MPYSAKTIEERKSLNGMWHKSKAKLTILRLALGLTSSGAGEVSRNHLYVPDTPGNALLDCATSLVEEGMMVEGGDGIPNESKGRGWPYSAKEGHVPGNVRFLVTDKGEEKAKSAFYINKKTKCPQEEPFSKENVLTDLQHSQELITGARSAIVEQMAIHLKIEDRLTAHKWKEIEEELSESITALSRACYMINAKPDKVRKA